jgi:hypothetical protein
VAVRPLGTAGAVVSAAALVVTLTVFELIDVPFALLARTR